MVVAVHKHSVAFVEHTAVLVHTPLRRRDQQPVLQNICIFKGGSRSEHFGHFSGLMAGIDISALETVGEPGDKLHCQRLNGAAGRAQEGPFVSAKVAELGPGKLGMFMMCG